MLLELSQFFPFCPPPPSTTYSLSPSPNHCSCQWVMRVSSLATSFPVLYFTSHGYSVTTYLYLLIPSPLHPFPPHPSPHLATIKMLFESRILSLVFLSLTFGSLIMVYPGVGLFASVLFGTLCASWACTYISFTKLGKFSFSRCTLRVD